MAVRSAADGYLKRAGASAFGSVAAANFTGCVWIKRKVDTGGSATGFYVRDGEYFAQTEGGGDVMHFYEIVGGETDLTGPTLTIDTWFFILITRTNTSQKLYYGTEAGGTLTEVTASDSHTNNANIQEVWVFDDIYTEKFNGEIAYFRMWAASMTAAEADAEWRSTTPVKSGVLVDLRLAAAASAGTDSSGNGYDFTVTGTLTDGGTNPTPPAGAPTLEQEGYRFRNDDGSESTATWLAGQDTAATVNTGTTFRLRVLVNATNDPSSHGYKLQWKKSSDDALAWRDVKP